MNEDALRQLLSQLRAGDVGLDQVVERIRRLPFEDLGFATIDTHREIRCGFPEVIFCQGKTPAQVAAITERMLAVDAEVLASRADRDHHAAVLGIYPEAEYHEAARMIVSRR